MDRWVMFAWVAVIAGSLSMFLEKMAAVRLGWSRGTLVALLSGSVIIIPICLTAMQGKGQQAYSFVTVGVIAAVLAGLAGGVRFMSFEVSLQTGDITRIVPMMVMANVLAVILGYAFLREPITATKITGSLLAFVGAYLVVR